MTNATGAKAEPRATQARLSTKAQGLLTPELESGAYLSRLIERGYFRDAVRFMVQAMPIQESIWLGCLCAWHATGGRPDAQEDAALRCAVGWLIEPIEARRSEAWKSASAVGLDHPEGCMAHAAYLAGAAPGPKDPIAPFKVEQAARLVSAGISLSHAKAHQRRIPFRPRQVVTIGLQISQGQLPWTSGKS